MRGGNNGVGISRGDALLGRVESFLPLRNKQVDELNEKLRAEAGGQTFEMRTIDRLGHLTY